MNLSDSVMSAETDSLSAKKTILLVDDDRAIRRYLEVALQRAGYTVIAAADGLEAMKIVLASKIDALVTDAVMPHINGHELCRFVRRHPQLARLPIILLSGLQQSRPLSDAAEQADIYLDKPVRPNQITSCLAQLLNHST